MPYEVILHHFSRKHYTISGDRDLGDREDITLDLFPDGFHVYQTRELARQALGEAYRNSVDPDLYWDTWDEDGFPVSGRGDGEDEDGVLQEVYTWDIQEV